MPPFPASIDLQTSTDLQACLVRSNHSRSQLCINKIMSMRNWIPKDKRAWVLSAGWLGFGAHLITEECCVFCNVDITACTTVYSLQKRWRLSKQSCRCAATWPCCEPSTFDSERVSLSGHDRSKVTCFYFPVWLAMIVIDVIAWMELMTDREGCFCFAYPHSSDDHVKYHATKSISWHHSDGITVINKQCSVNSTVVSI